MSRFRLATAITICVSVVLVFSPRSSGGVWNRFRVQPVAIYVPPPACENCDRKSKLEAIKCWWRSCCRYKHPYHSCYDPQPPYYVHNHGYTPTLWRRLGEDYQTYSEPIPVPSAHNTPPAPKEPGPAVPRPMPDPMSQPAPIEPSTRIEPNDFSMPQPVGVARLGSSSIPEVALLHTSASRTPVPTAGPVLADWQGRLCIVREWADIQRGMRQLAYWPVGIRTADFTNLYGEQLLQSPVQHDGGGFYTHPKTNLKLRLIDGAVTAPIRVEQSGLGGRNARLPLIGSR